MNSNSYVPDESAISLKVASRLVREGKVCCKIIVHNATVSSIEAKAKIGNLSGINGLKDLREACAEKNVKLEYAGDPNEGHDVNHVNREFARSVQASIITCNPIMAKVSEALGIRVVFESPSPSIELDKVFTDGVMSLHLKEKLPPRVKRGHPGRWFFEKLSETPLSKEELESILAQLMEQTYSSLGEDAFIEVDKIGATIIQLKDFRIVVTHPPFSDGLEITITRPMLKRSIEDYHLPSQVLARLREQAEGILVAGPPGMGKSTFAQALAEHYNSLGRVVKTIESPRDLDLPPDITQYSKKAAKEGELHDVLLLSRPDYTIFDEMRGEDDFKIFIDLRFAGIGMVGVLHGTNPMDAIRRIAHKVDVGVLPSIVDTLIFMDKGLVSQIYMLEMTVKVPAGLRREDLSRPTVLVKNLFTGEVEYELYVFGERTFFVPVKGRRRDGDRDRDDKSKAVFSQILSRHLDSFDLNFDGGTLKILIPQDEFKTYLKKCQKRVLKAARRSNIEIEAVPI
ncbi:MAG: Flp pilus assembly complex ATPase component TadA [archaeon]|nr:Flp pilus assembly complex ATPase component TadA [archaeon]MCP8306534.1 Flp pilus assembly complex ATPase component TadA [archaeon]